MFRPTTAILRMTVAAGLVAALLGGCPQPQQTGLTDADLEALRGAPGAQGPQGEQGPPGDPGEPGDPGAPGLDCWDTDGDGVNDPNEDTNGDGAFNALDCRGADGLDGQDGQDGASPFALVGNDAVYTQGNVGIGTDTPSATLDVVGPSQFTGDMGVTGDVIVDGTVFANAVSSNSPLLLQTAGTTRVFVDDATGNVGIGTDTPGEALDVNGDALIQGNVTAAASGLVRMLIQTLDNQFASLRLQGDVATKAGEMWLDVAAQSLNIKAIGDTQRLKLMGDSNQGVTIDANGNVGVGTDTPAERLDVAGNANVSGDAFISGNATVAGNANITGVTSVAERVEIGDSFSALDDLVIARQTGSHISPALRMGTRFANEEYTGIIMFDELVGALADPNQFCGVALHYTGATNELRFVGGCSNTTVDNGQLALSVHRSGNVGIGTSADAIPPTVGGTRLTINGDVEITGTLTATTKNFAHPHPTDPALQINYVCLEGAESATYFRGSGRLVDGRYEIVVPEHFRLVTQAEGLTVQVTAMGPGSLWVEHKGLDRIVVRGSADIAFDYLVHGRRRGYGDPQPIVPNKVYRPKESGVPFGAALPEGVRAILRANGVLNADDTPNEATAAALGWSLTPRRAASNAPAADAVPTPAGGSLRP